MTNSPYIEIRKNRGDQNRAYLIGTRVKVQDVVIIHERFGESAEEIATSHFPHLSLAQVHGALAYFFENQEVIWKAIQEDHAFALKMQRIMEAKGQQDAQQSSVSS